MRPTKSGLFVVLSFAILSVPRGAHATPIVVGPWNEFSFTAVGVQARGCAPPDPLGLTCSPPGLNSILIGAPPWTLSNAQPVLFRITDGFISGDAFQVFDAGALILTTPMVATGNTCVNDPDSCYISPTISHGSVTLAPGTHSITITPNEVTSLGAAFFDVVPVPEPSSFVLLLSSLVPIGYALQRRRSVATRKSSNSYPG
jgi:hypothetical protein